MSPGQLSSQLASTGAVFVRYPWADTNGDRFVQASEVNTSVPFLSKSNAYDPANPTNAFAPAVIDPIVSTGIRATTARSSTRRPPARQAHAAKR
jgi:hypothetical protein